MRNTDQGVLLRIELGRNRPSRAELLERIGDLARQLRPQAVIAGLRQFDDAVEVAIVANDRYRAAARAGGDALRRLCPWEEGEGEEVGWSATPS